MTATRQTLFITRSAPFHGTQAFACLDVLLTTAVFDQKVLVVFSEDGVYQLLDQQQGDAIQSKTLAQTLPALELYDVNDLFVMRDSLSARNIAVGELVVPAKEIDAAVLAQMINTSDQVYVF